MMQVLLEAAVKAGRLREIDLHAALFVNRLAAKPSAELLLAAALASRAVGEGHICMPLELSAGQDVFSPDVRCRAPELARWRDCLVDSGVVGAPGSGEPLVLDEADRLYLNRYFRCESSIAGDLLRRSRGMIRVVRDHAAPLLARLFPDAGAGDWQKAAVAVAAVKRFVVISGGPGTGKTYTVARVLALLQALSGGSLRIGLAAPTGKAAVRLQESIGKARLTIDEDLAAMVPAETHTLHRLLGFSPADGSFRHNRENRLQLDLLIVDEASMIDVPLMAALVEALPAETRVVMLGDRDQLTSVEAGSLFGDICSQDISGWSDSVCGEVEALAGWAPPPEHDSETFADSIVLLRTSYRFRGREGISSLARAVNSEDKDFPGSIPDQGRGDLVLLEPDQDRDRSRLSKRLLSGFRHLFEARDPGEALASLDRFRVLCAVREGPQGVAGMNLLAEQVLHRHGVVTAAEQWYRGRPVIIRSNHYGLRLFNGDTGVTWPDGEGKQWAWFSRPDGSLHQVPLSRLPEHDTAYAITVHQSQGSEFAEVLFVLPEVDSRVLCRELLYTGITRARDRLVLYCDSELLATWSRRRIVRYSGLREKLWKTGG